jgi:hypothetical protein
MVDYACRDDYGALAGDVSAWAGIHYFASREPGQGDDLPPFTWPEGNGWIVARLLERIGSSVHTGAPVYRIERRGTSWRVLTGDVAWMADAVIVATPFLVASRILDDLPGDGVAYSPWLTANLTLDRWPRESGSSCMGQRHLRLARPRLCCSYTPANASAHSANGLDLLLALVMTPMAA